MARDPKYDVLFEPIQLGPKNNEEPLLPDPPLQRLRLREASGPGLLPGDEGRRRLRRLLHGVLLDLAGIRRHAPASPPGSGTTTTSRTSPVMCDMLHEHGALAACELCTGPHAPCMETRCRGARHRFRATSSISPTARRWTEDDIREVQQLYVDAAKRADGGLRHRVRVRVSLLPAAAVPDAVLQQANR